MSTVVSSTAALSPAGQARRRASALRLSRAQMPPALDVSSPRLSVSQQHQGPKSAFARLSYHVSSPLFDLSTHKLSSPTFSISFTTAETTSKSISPPPPLGYSASSVSDASVYSLSTAAGERPPFDRSASMPVPSFMPSARSLDDQGKEMIDHQLEMLSQLFPKDGHKHGERDSHASASARIESQTDVDIVDITSDYQPTPGEAVNKHDSSRISKLLAEWPAMDDIPDPADESADSDAQSALAKLQAHPSMTDSSPPGGSSMPSVDLTSDSGSHYPSSSVGSSLASRRSVNPHLSVDPARTQKFAVKELELIRRMKDQGVAKRAEKEPSKPPAITRSVSSPIKRTSKSPRLSAVGVPSADVQLTDKKPVTQAQALLHAAKRKSTDSATSGIIWSAVVEKFSEMAQEIAGKVSPKRGERRSNLSIASTARSDRRASIQTTTSTIRPSKTAHIVTSPVQEEEVDAAGFGVSVTDSIATDLPQSVSTAGDLPTISMPYTSPLPRDVASESSASPPSDSPAALLSPIKLKRRSKSTAALQSILKRGDHSRSASDVASPDTGSASDSPLSRPWARKAGRSVRVQSHHANVEGDYAAFLKRASRVGGFGNTFDAMGDEEGSDKQSVKSGRSGRSVSSRHSGKSGVENGCFRRGSMSSIKTGRTIATVGGVSVKDMSRGARFRHPSPFFATGRGLTKPPHGPHQKGNPGLHLRQRRKDARRLSADMKRSSADGETLGAALARMKEEKRKNAPTDLIGELSFENNKPARKYTAEEKGKGRAAPAGALPPKPRGPPALTASALNALNASQNPKRPGGYAASAFTPGSAAGSQMRMHGPGSAMGYSQLSATRSGQMPGFKPGYAASAITPAGYPKPGGSVLSTLSASRQQILGSGQSNISLQSIKPLQIQRAGGPGALASATANRQPSGSQLSVGGHQRSKSGGSSNRLQQQNMQDMMLAENSFISMTPGARSDLSAISARSDRDLAMMSGGSSAPLPPLPGQPGLPPTSAVRRSPPQSAAGRHQRQASNASGRSPQGNSPPQSGGGARAAFPHRSNTDPLPPLPNGGHPLPLRTMSNGGQVDGNGLSAAGHRAHPPLIVNTDAAKAHASKSMKLKALAAEENQRRASAASHASSINHGHSSAARNTMQAQGRAAVAQQHDSPEVITADTMGLPAGVFGSAAKTPKTGAFASVANVFSAGPKRPARTDSGLPERHPRPPSVEPLEEDFARDADNKSLASKKSVKNLFGFGKKK